MSKSLGPRGSSDQPFDEIREGKKRRRELFFALPLAVLFLLLTWLEFKLFDISQSLPFVHSVFFFGLVNFNIIILLLLLFLIFRNVVKVFAEKQQGVLGSTLKGKLIAAFVGFSFVPTALMFLVSVFYINNSFDKWFSDKMAGVLKSSLEITNAYYLMSNRKNYHFAGRMARALEENPQADLSQLLIQFSETYALDSVEYYPGLLGERVLVTSRDEVLPSVPAASLEFLKRGIQQRAEASTIHHFDEGNLIRVIVPVQRGSESGALVVSSFVPLSLIAKIDDIATAYEDFRDVNPLEYPLKSIYLIILFLMTMVILLGATWFGFYLARQLSIPLEELGGATQRVAKGDYALVEISSGSAEINQLIRHFNHMTKALAKSEQEVQEANSSLKETLSRLDEHMRYIKVVLSNVSTGVISVDQDGQITMINHHAAKLLGIDPELFVGRSAREVLSPDYYSVFEEMIGTMKKHRAESLQKEVRITVKGRSMPLQMTLSVLYDDQRRELGKVLVFDDLTPVLSAQRAQAWTEVARRIAHEIKNPLTPIRLSAQRLQKKFSEQIEDPAFSDCTRMIISQVDDLKNLVNEFSNFARMPKSNPVPADLNQVLEESLVLFRSAHRHLEIILEKDETLPVFKFDPDQIRRAITNLMDNSIAALKGREGAQVKLSTKYDPLLRIVRVEVADNGEGVPDALRDQIFEPYFTSKENGTGLGLAIVKRSVEDHHGFIRAFANEPEGIRFVIELPVLESKSSDWVFSTETAEEQHI